MKKLVGLLLVAGMVTFVACGPSKKDQEAKEKAKQDSIAAAEKAQKEADSLASVEKAKHVADSLKQDSIAKADKKHTTKSVQPTKTKEQKVKENINKSRG
jgi:flagellar biosynthesis component FlhA